MTNVAAQSKKVLKHFLIVDSCYVVEIFIEIEKHKYFNFFLNYLSGH